ncbi:PepSY-associated TM helix domain-containing protein [Hydrogenophaga sp. BPS33]|uniref:PepSY-associated TM helix domain-containing protein n=1 Tax=Hydrogenophaga sp. BPS33 TaxID=2651974 RepID=UPI00131FF88A|nr:PepSY-associated TM helix domain-containing protein [Hydrogenophaga sp. BPS33]QHE87159.1 PepSY domain-containing protein [Hydrogenophaga sp. BPS33]
MKAATLRAWSWVHKWSSLVSTVFLLLLCITGLPLIFHEEIEHAFEPAPQATGEFVAGTQAGEAPSLDSVVAHALQQARGGHVNFVLIQREESLVQVGTSPSRQPSPDESRTHLYDLHTGAVLQAPSAGDDGFMDVMLRLHTDLYMGLGGTLFLGFMGLLVAVAVVSGVLLYAPFMSKLPFGTVRHDHARRTRWLDMHNLLGIGTVVWLTVVSLTGTINTLEVPLGHLWRNNDLAAMRQRHAGAPPAQAFASLHQVLAAARETAPKSQVDSIIFPGMKISGPRHHLVILRGDKPATRQLVQVMLVDAESGRVSDHASMPWYVQALSMSQPLHFGDYGGIPLKVLWAVLTLTSIAVLGSGLYLWLTKPSKARIKSRAPIDDIRSGDLRP